MGFFSSLMGWDQSMGGLNAVLASHLIENANEGVRKRIAQEVANIIMSVRPGQQVQSLLAELSKRDRVVQMNFVALACDNLNIHPSVPGNVWSRVENPYRIGTQVTPAHIASAIEVVNKQNGVRLNWPGNSVQVDFNKMHTRGLLC